MKKIFLLLISFAFAGMLCAQQTVTVTLKGTVISKASDATTVTPLWKHTRGTGGVITSPGSLTTTVTNLPVGEHQFTIYGTDNFGATGSDTVHITVDRQNIPPVMDAGPDQTVTAGVTSMSVPPSDNSYLAVKVSTGKGTEYHYYKNGIEAKVDPLKLYAYLMR